MSKFDVKAEWKKRKLYIKTIKKAGFRVLKKNLFSVNPKTIEESFSTMTVDLLIRLGKNQTSTLEKEMRLESFSFVIEEIKKQLQISNPKNLHPKIFDGYFQFTKKHDKYPKDAADNEIFTKMFREFDKNQKDTSKVGAKESITKKDNICQKRLKLNGKWEDEEVEDEKAMKCYTLEFGMRLTKFIDNLKGGFNELFKRFRISDVYGGDVKKENYSRPPPALFCVLKNEANKIVRSFCLGCCTFLSPKIVICTKHQLEFTKWKLLQRFERLKELELCLKSFDKNKKDELSNQFCNGSFKIRSAKNKTFTCTYCVVIPKGPDSSCENYISRYMNQLSLIFNTHPERNFFVLENGVVRNPCKLSCRDVDYNLGKKMFHLSQRIMEERSLTSNNWWLSDGLVKYLNEKEYPNRKKSDISILELENGLTEDLYNYIKVPMELNIKDKCTKDADKDHKRCKNGQSHRCKNSLSLKTYYSKIYYRRRNGRFYPKKEFISYIVQFPRMLHYILKYLIQDENDFELWNLMLCGCDNVDKFTKYCVILINRPDVVEWLLTNHDKSFQFLESFSSFLDGLNNYSISKGQAISNPEWIAKSRFISVSNDDEEEGEESVTFHKVSYRNKLDWMDKKFKNLKFLLNQKQQLEISTVKEGLLLSAEELHNKEKQYLGVVEITIPSMDGTSGAAVCDSDNKEGAVGMVICGLSRNVMALMISFSSLDFCMMYVELSKKHNFCEFLKNQKGLAKQFLLFKKFMRYAQYIWKRYMDCIDVQIPKEVFEIEGQACFNGNCLKSLNLKQCSGCGLALYCSRECQSGHWKVHKRICEKKMKKK